MWAYFVIERSDFNEAREHWQIHKDPRKALELFPKQCHAERAILNYFVKTGRTNDYQGAIMAVWGTGICSRRVRWINTC